MTDTTATTTTTTGAWYGGSRDVAAIARDVRADLRVADLPRSIEGHRVTYAVRSQRFSQGQSVDVVIRGLPDAVALRPDIADLPPSRWLTPAVAGLHDAVHALADAYNRRTGPSQRPLYYLDVRVERDDERPTPHRRRGPDASDPQHP